MITQQVTINRESYTVNFENPEFGGTNNLAEAVKKLCDDNDIDYVAADICAINYIAPDKHLIKLPTWTIFADAEGYTTDGLPDDGIDTIALFSKPIAFQQKN